MKFYLFWTDLDGRTYQDEEYDDEVKVIYATQSKLSRPEVITAWYESM
jgi:hypothetical protein